MKFSMNSYYRRPSSKHARTEDGHAINKGIVVVTDGVSEPYVGEPRDYGEGQSGGTVVSNIICDTISQARPPCDICELLLEANAKILRKHQSMGMDVDKQAVAGASIAACQIMDEEAVFVLAGDTGIFWDDERGFHFLSNFTPSAHGLEEAGCEFFEVCKRFATMVGAKPWELYRAFFEAKQYFRANRHFDKNSQYIAGYNGGHAMMNGGPVESCWTVERISLSGVKWILILTDGLLWRDFRPEHHQGVANTFNRGGIPALLELRDSLDRQPHIDGWPEGTAIILKPKLGLVS